MVYVLTKDGRPLMPTKRHGKVRHMLDDGRAVVERVSPFTIRLTYDTPEHTQPVTLGVDAGSKHVGISACTDREELFCAELQPRNDVVDLLSSRRENRRGRRNRKKRYRQPRFNNRVQSKHKGWQAPSVEVKIHNHIQGIRLAASILPISLIRIETAEFDLQLLKAMEEGKPVPEGTDYQLGEMYGYYNTKQYVLHRDGYTCRCCGAHPTEKKPVKLHVHHLESRKTGGDAPNNLITLCEGCHAAYHKGLIELPEKAAKRGKRYKDAAFMGIMRKTLIQRLRSELDIPVQETYGYITKAIRETNGITKTHVSDARCIAQAPKAQRAEEQYLIKPVRRHNRQIHKAKISKGGYRKSNQAPKYVFGFQLFDRVRYKDREYFIFGRRSRGTFDIRTLGGKRAETSWKKLKLLETRKSLLIERRSAGITPALG